MGLQTNAAGVTKAKTLIGAGAIDRLGGWSLSESESTTMLGDPINWSGFSTFFLAFDESKPADDKARWHYPIGKLDAAGKATVSLAALRAVKVRAAKRGETAIMQAATDLIAAAQPGSRHASPETTIFNEQLCGKRMEIRERLGPANANFDGKDREAVISDAAGMTIGPVRAKVAHADKENGNGRIYPREVMAPQIAAMNEKAKSNLALGAVDHPGYSGGQKDMCIKWDNFKMEDDGSITADRKIIARHSKGADLAALTEADIPLSYSLRGWGSAHAPSEVERNRYNLPEDTDAVIIEPDYEMGFVDCVDRPAVPDARDLHPASNKSTAKDSLRDSSNNHRTENDMKTLEDLKAQNPAIHALHIAAIAAAVADALKPKEDLIAKLQPKADALDKMIPVVDSVIARAKENSFFKVPERQISTAEDQARLDAAKKEANTAKEDLTKANGTITDLRGQLDARKKTDDTADRKKKVGDKLADLLKDSDWKDEIETEIKDTKLLDADSFTVEAAEKMVADRVKTFDRIRGNQARNDYWGPRGGKEEQTDDKDDKNKGKGGSANDSHPLADLAEA